MNAFSVHFANNWNQIGQYIKVKLNWYRKFPSRIVSWFRKQVKMIKVFYERQIFTQFKNIY